MNDSDIDAWFASLSPSDHEAFDAMVEEEEARLRAEHAREHCEDCEADGYCEFIVELVDITARHNVALELM